MLTDKEIQVLKLRKQGLTQVEVARKLGITQAAVSNFEKNSHRKIKEAEETISIAEKLGVKDNE